jgi:hypothetical protein
LRNDIIHGNGMASIAASANFLTVYAESLQVGGRGSHEEIDLKGKAKVVDTQCPKMKSTDQAGGDRKMLHWEPPPHGWVKINTDARYNETIGEASTG